MATLGTFLTLVKSSARLGSRVDDLILASARHALLSLERNYTFRYMRRADVIFFDTTTGRGPYLTSAYPKVVEGVCIYEELSLTPTQIYWLTRIQVTDADNFLTARPEAYEIRSERELWVNTFPDRLYYGRAFYSTLSIFPSLTTSNMYASTDSLWLVTYGEDVFLWQTLLQLGTLLRDGEMVSTAKVNRDEALRSLLLSEDTFETAGESMELSYRGSYDSV